MSLLELGFELFEEILLLDNVSRVIPLARSESTRNGGAIGRNLLKLECSTGSIEGRLESIDLLLEFCQLSAEVEHGIDDFEWIE